MINIIDTVASFFRVIRAINPDHLDLITARNEEEFYEAFDKVLESAVDDLETNKKNLRNLGEEGFTAFLCMGLKVSGLSVTQETNSNGHVDMMIKPIYSKPVRTVLFEAKKYHGPQYHFGGLAQLVDRYSTGRASRAFLVVYCCDKDIKGAFEKLQEEMDADHPCHQKGQTKTYSLKWSFLSTHTHTSGEDLDVAHIGCNLFC